MTRTTRSPALSSPVPALMLAGRLLAAAFLASSTLAAEPLQHRHSSTAGVPPGQTKVALIDLGDVFRRLDRFRQRLAQLKQDVDTLEAELRDETDAMEKKRKRISKYKRPSHRLEAEQEVAKLATEIQLKRELKKQSIAAEEAKMYFAALVDIKRELRTLCEEHRIDVVLRYDRSPVNQHDRDAVLSRCNSTIVYHHRLDVTDVIVARLNQRQGWAARPYGAPTIRGQLGKQSKWLTTIPAIAVQQVISARAAWAVDRVVFPPGS